MQQAVEKSLVDRRPSLKAQLEAFERQLIETALAATSGNQRRAAASLGLLPTTLHEKMRRLGLLKRRVECAPEEEARKAG